MQWYFLEVQLAILSEQAQKLIAIQRRRYIDSMPAKRQVIMQCMSQVTAAIDNGEPELCDLLFQQVHRLAGSAGSYGFETLGQAASAVDAYLIAHAPEPTKLPELGSLLQTLVDEIDKVVFKNDA